MAILKSLCAVAWADGHVADDEREVIEALLQAFGASETEAQLIRDYVSEPKTLDDIPLTDLSGDDRRVRLWKRATGKLQAVYDLPSPVVGCRFLPDGRLAAWAAHGEPHLLKFVDWAQDD